MLALIPAGDSFNSRGQRPRKVLQQIPTLNGSIRGDVPTVLGKGVGGSATPSGSGIKRHVFRGRCPRLLTCALAGRKNFASGCHLSPQGAGEVNSNYWSLQVFGEGAKPCEF